MIAEHITLEGNQVSIEHSIVPEYVLEYHDEDWPMSDIAFWHWLYHHFES